MNPVYSCERWSIFIYVAALHLLVWHPCTPNICYLFFGRTKGNEKRLCHLRGQNGENSSTQQHQQRGKGKPKFSKFSNLQSIFGNTFITSLQQNHKGVPHCTSAGLDGWKSFFNLNNYLTMNNQNSWTYVQILWEMKVFQQCI